MTNALQQNNKYSFVYGHKTIDYNLFYSERKTLEIAVHPDNSIIVKAPLNSDTSLIEKKIIKRSRWILKQINYFKQFTPKTPVRFYVNGETHLYLGRQYRLKISLGNENSVKLTKGFFQITSRNQPTPEVVKKLLNKWYLEKAAIQFDVCIDRCWNKFNRFELAKPTISIKRMQKRWGSLSDKNTVTLNTDLIKAPKECIDYVITHELCHLKHRNHSREFYKLLDSIIPGWEKIKNKLELRMV